MKKAYWKMQIDHYRQLIEWEKFNIKEISFDIQSLPPDLDKLLEEHHYTLERIKAFESTIDELQPWYRKLIGVPY